jgi:periplasmic protein TonB
VPRPRPPATVPRLVRATTPKATQTPPPAEAAPATPMAPAPAADVVALPPDDSPASVRAEAVPARSVDGPAGADHASAVDAAAKVTTTSVAPTTPSPPAPAAVASLGPVATQPALPRGGYQVIPSYPRSARRLGIEGITLLRVFVQADGRVGDVIVRQSAGHPDLDRAAADAVRRWEFEPARQGASAIAMWVDLPVEFQLH